MVTVSDRQKAHGKYHDMLLYHLSNTFASAFGLLKLMLFKFIYFIKHIYIVSHLTAKNSGFCACGACTQQIEIEVLLPASQFLISHVKLASNPALDFLHTVSGSSADF